MESWALVAGHPYYTVTDDHGRFSLTDIPLGSYRIVVWHPYLREAAAQDPEIQLGEIDIRFFDGHCADRTTLCQSNGRESVHTLQHYG